MLTIVFLIQTGEICVVCLGRINDIKNDQIHNYDMIIVTRFIWMSYKGAMTCLGRPCFREEKVML